MFLSQLDPKMQNPMSPFVLIRVKQPLDLYSYPTPLPLTSKTKFYKLPAAVAPQIEDFFEIVKMKKYEKIKKSKMTTTMTKFSNKMPNFSKIFTLKERHLSPFILIKAKQPLHFKITIFAY